MPKHPGGRPSKFSADRADKILLALRSGSYLYTAAAYAGIHRDTLDHWLRQGANARKGHPLRQFHEDVGHAMADFEVVATSMIRANGVGRPAQAATEKTAAQPAVPGDWRALAWLLERRHRKRWGIKATIQGDPNSPIPVEHRGLQITVVQSNPVDKDGRVLTAVAAAAEAIVKVAEAATKEDGHGA